MSALLLMFVELPEWNAYTCNKIDLNHSRFLERRVSFLLPGAQVAVLLSPVGSGHVLQTDRKGPISSSKPSDTLLRQELKQPVFRLSAINESWIEWICALVGLQFSTHIKLLYIWLNKSYIRYVTNSVAWVRKLTLPTEQATAASQRS
jgi:hypothetical protein